MKYSHAFAAFRTSLITDANHAIKTELVPEFNSRCEDIRRKAETDFETYHNQAKANNLRKSLNYDLILYREQILEEVQKTITDKINERLARDSAELIEETVPDKRVEGRMKNVLTAIFPDKSRSRVPTKLWIDFSMFDRV